MKLVSTVTHRNGGFEQGILQVMEDEGLINEEDKKRLEYLKSLSQNRTEIINEHEVKEKK